MNFSPFRTGALAFAAAGLFAFAHLKVGSIRGTIMPAEAGVRAWAESVTDTPRAAIVNGTFEIPDCKPGVYKLIIEAKPPYRNAAKDGIIVSDGQATDAGEIKLEK